MLPVGAWEQKGLNRAEKEMLSSVLLGVKEMWGLCRPEQELHPQVAVSP